MAKTKTLFQPHPEGARKGERTRKHVLESAFRCIARDGYYRTTFQTIADQAKISQPMIVKIFKARENIFPQVLNAVVDEATRLTEAHLKKYESQSLKRRIEAYFDVSIAMFTDTPDLAGFYMNIQYLSTYDPRVNEMNQKMRAGALARLGALLREGGYNKRQSEDLSANLHDQLVGFILVNISLGGPWDVAQLKRGLKLRPVIE